MALQFQPPPDWLIQQYMQRKTAGESVSDAIGQGLNTYATIKQMQADKALKQQALDIQKAGLLKDYATAKADLGVQADAIYAPILGNNNVVPSSPTVAGTGSSLIEEFEKYRQDPTAYRSQYGNKQTDRITRDYESQQKYNDKPILDPKGKQIGTAPYNAVFAPQTPTPASIKPPQGYRFTANGDLEAIPGGPATVKKDAATEKIDTVYDLYETARDGLLAALKETITGPVVGRAPAFTEKQQTAEGAVAAMAPALKQLFRVAGEGTFTDRDQELLLSMVPTRKTEPEAAAKIIANMDNIVRAKLGRKSAARSSGGPHGQSVTQNGVTYNWNPATGQYE